jgi:hypothetical protein
MLNLKEKDSQTKHQLCCVLMGGGGGGGAWGVEKRGGKRFNELPFTLPLQTSKHTIGKLIRRSTIQLIPI